MKIAALQRQLRENKIDCAVLYSTGMESDPNVYYFTQYGGVGCLVVPQSSSPFLIVPKMERERAKKGLIKRVLPLEKKKFFESVHSHLAKTKKKIVGIDKNRFSLNVFKTFQKAFKKSKVRDISGMCHELRTEKTKKEILYTKKACSMTDAILKKCISNYTTFKTEADAAAFLRSETFRRGLDVSFPPIVASGAHGSMPHYVPQKVKLQKGLCVIDFGVKYRGYCSDITRTIGVKKVSEKEITMYQKLLSIQKNVISILKEGMKCSDVYRYVVDALGRDANYFTHGLGHGIGVEIHELPNLTLNSADNIQNNSTFTVEPGVYFPGKFGIRIEDSILFRKKSILLTKVSKELTIV